MIGREQGGDGDGGGWIRPRKEWAWQWCTLNPDPLSSSIVGVDPFCLLGFTLG